MQGYNTIEELLNAPEGERFELKEAKVRFDSGEAARYCCALSNCGGGRLVLGVSNKLTRHHPVGSGEPLGRAMKTLPNYRILEGS